MMLQGKGGGKAYRSHKFFFGLFCNVSSGIFCDPQKIPQIVAVFLRSAKEGGRLQLVYMV